ncbi:MAG: flavodoxin family protein [Proteobacteria bacterium]|nr:flavodoxin family protein [Pseudomonadota bacterium]
MSKTIVAIIGSYRRGCITEQTVDAMLAEIERRGGRTEKILLTEKRIEFCRNCRACTQEAAEKRRGRCVIEDEMEGILDSIDSASAVILAAPVNFSNTTAIMKRFIERLICYTYWPWTRMIPASRIKRERRRAVLFTSSGAPAIVNRIIMPCPLKALKVAADVMGARDKRTIYMGLAGKDPGQNLGARDLCRANSAAAWLLG